MGEGTLGRERKFAVFLTYSRCNDEKTKAHWPPELRITYFGHNLPKTMFKGSYLNFKEDEWLVYGVCF